MGVILVLLAIAWGLVLGPRFLKSRADRGSSFSDFRLRLSVMQQGRLPLAGVSGPARQTRRANDYVRRKSQKRRRDILAGLVALSLATLAIGLAPGFRSILVVSAVVDVLLVSYATLLIRRKNVALYSRYDRPVLAYQPIDD